MKDGRESLVNIASGDEPSRYELILDGITYSLAEVIGMGGSSIVYRGYYIKNQKPKPVIIKELYPKKGASSFQRNPDGSIAVRTDLPENARAKAEDIFAFYKERAARENDILDFLQLCEEGKNIDTRFFDGKSFTSANNTVYTVLATENGDMLSEMLDRRKDGVGSELSAFTEICECVLRILEALEPIHEKGYLHLDVAPDNIFISKYVTGEKRQAKLIDFNSAFNPYVDTLKNFIFSKKDGFSACELNGINENEPEALTYATDLYSVAATFFFMLKKRIPTVMDLSMRSEWELTNESEYCENLSSVTLAKCNDLIEKGICIYSGARYQNICDFRTDMEDLISSITAQALVNTPNLSTIKFFGRDKQLQDIDERLQQSNAVFLEGMGGIGKTELAKRYVCDERYRGKYDTVQLLHYDGRIISTVAAGLCFDNFNVGYYESCNNPEEAEEKVYCDKHRLLSKCDERTLIIIDGFDVPYDDNLADLLSLQCRFIFTTRNRHKNSIEITRMDNMADLLELFCDNYTRRTGHNDETEGCIKDIIELVDGHTMTLELIAKTLDDSGMMPQQMHEKLRKGFDTNVKVFVDFKKDEKEKENHMYAHILRVLDISSVLDDEINHMILMNMSLMPCAGIAKYMFCEWAGLDDVNGINRLIKSGWIKEDKVTDTISLHPVVSDIAYTQLKPDGVKCGRLIEAVFRHIEERKEKAYKNSISGDAHENEHNETIRLLKLLLKRINDYDVPNAFKSGHTKIVFMVGSFNCFKNCETEFTDNIFLLFKNRKFSNTITYIDYMYHKKRINDDKAHVAFSCFFLAARFCNSKAMVYLSRMYILGIGVPPDREEGFKWMMRAAEAGYSEAMKFVGYYFSDGIGTEINEELSLHWHMEYIKSVGTDGYSDIAFLYGDLKCEKQKFEWNLRGNTAGSIKSKERLASDYYYGKGTEKNYEKAFKLYYELAETGDEYAVVRVADSYYYGEGTEKDCRKAFEWYMRAAEKGHVESEEQIAHMYYNGYGVEKSNEESLKWYMRSGEHGDGISCYYVGIMYNDGTGTQKNYKEALEWFKKADAKNEIEAKAYLCYYYYFGKGTDVDKDKAMIEYTCLLERANSFFEYYLSDKGKNINNEWMIASTKTYELCNISSITCLAYLFIDENAGAEIDRLANDLISTVVEFNHINLLSAKAKSKHTEAILEFAKMYRDGRINGQKDYSKSLELLYKANDLGDKNALTVLGHTYKNGWGVEISKELALKYYIEAKDAGVENMDDLIAEVINV